MKKILIFLVVLALTGMATFAAEPTEREIGSLWLQVIELNRSQFPDSNKVSVGDTVKIPGDSCVIVQSWNLTGGKNCLWNIGRSILIGDTNLAKIPAVTTPAILTPFTSPWDLDEKTARIFAALFLGAIIVGFIIWRLRERELSLNNPSHPPVVRGGLTGTPQQVLNTIQHHVSKLHPGKIVTKVEAGKLQSITHPDGDVRFIAKVRNASSSNPVTKKLISNGALAWQATIAESNNPNAATHTEIWLARCGNEVCTELPDDWQFIPEEGKVAEAPVETIVSTTPTPAASTTLEAGNGKKDLSISLNDGKESTITVAVSGHEMALPARIEKSDGNDGSSKLVVTFRHQIPTEQK